MKASKLSDAQKAFILKQGKHGTPVVAVAWKFILDFFDHGREFSVCKPFGLVLSCGRSRLVLKASGEIELVGTEITVAGGKIWLN